MLLAYSPWSSRTSRSGSLQERLTEFLTGAITLASVNPPSANTVAVVEDDQRELWFARAAGPLPVRVLRRSDGNAIEMQLTTLSTTAQPVPE